MELRELALSTKSPFGDLGPSGTFCGVGSPFLSNVHFFLIEFVQIFNMIIHYSQKGPYFRDRIPNGTFLIFGFLFIFKGPYFQWSAGLGKFPQESQFCVHVRKN